MKRLKDILMTAATALFVTVLPVFALTPVDVNRTGTVTLTGYPPENAVFKFYKVADADENMSFTLTEEFAPLEGPVIVNEIHDQDTWEEQAKTLANHVTGIQPYKTEVYKDQKCEVQLETGLYLVLSDPVEYEGYTYRSLPMLLSVPTSDRYIADTKEWVYDYTAVVKHEKEKIPEQDYKVLKKWADGKGEARPAEIVVNILEDGKVIETVTLNKDNNWHYTWKGRPGKVYSVQEVKVPEGYKVTYSEKGTCFTITNRKDSQPNTGDTANTTMPMIGLCIGGLTALLAGFILLKNRQAEE